MLNDAVERTRHGYAAMSKAAGFQGPEKSDDEMGDLTVTGDQTYHIQAPPQKSGVPGWAAALMVAGAGAAGLAGAQMLPDRQSDPVPVVVEDDQQIGYELDFFRPEE